MRLLAVIPIFALATVVLFPARVTREPAPRSRIDRVEPEAARPGDMVEASGVNLGRSFVLELMLATVDRSVLAHIVAQSDAAIQFRVPRALAPGMFRIELVVATRWGTEVVEQPVTIRVLPADAPIQTSLPPRLARRR